MHTHDIEPIRGLSRRTKKFDFAISERPKKSLVADVAHAIECELSTPLLKQEGLNFDVVGLVSSPVVIDESNYLEDVERGQMAFLDSVTK